MVLDELLHVVLGEIVGFDVGLHKLFVGDGPQVGQLLQLHEELLEIQLHQRPALVAALLHVGVAAGQNAERRRQQVAISIIRLSFLSSVTRHTGNAALSTSTVSYSRLSRWRDRPPPPNEDRRLADFEPVNWSN